MDLSDEFLVESKAARDQGLARIRAKANEEQILNKVKALVFAVWRGVSCISRKQLADFYEVPVETINTNYKRHKDEFELDGAKVVKGEDLKEVKFILNLTSSTPGETVYTAAAALRMGFILRDSEVAKQVRTVAIQMIQGMGRQVNSSIVLQRLTQSHPLLASFTEGSRLKISAPYSRYWLRMKSILPRKYPEGGIPGMTTDDIRKEIQFLSTYTDSFKLQGIKELSYELSGEIKGKYPGLISDVISYQSEDGEGSAVVMFQFDKLIIHHSYVENCVGRRYIPIARDCLGVDQAFLIFVAPFGATSYAEDYIRSHLPLEQRGCVGVLTVKDLAQFLYTQADAARKLGIMKGEIRSEFKRLLNYEFPDPPKQFIQGSLFDNSEE